MIYSVVSSQACHHYNGRDQSTQPSSPQQLIGLDCSFMHACRDAEPHAEQHAAEA